MAVSHHILDVYRDALSSDEPLWTLREKVVAELAENGDDRDRVVADLEQLRAVLREEGRDDDEEIVLEVIGMILGWSGPRVRI
jgi:hypothetical protein